MKYSKILLLCIAISTLNSSAHELSSLQQSTINKKVVEIEKRMSRDRYIVYGLTALSIAQHVYPWIIVYQKGVEFSKKDTSEKVPMWQAIKASFSHLFYTQEGWTTIAQAGFGVAGSIVISRICDKFVHPDTLRWYVHSHAPYMMTISIMKKQQESIDSKKFLHLLHNRLVRQAEVMCAYEIYKCKRLDDDEEKEIAQRALRTLFMVQQYWLKRIAAQLRSEVIDYQELHIILDQYEAEIRQQLNHFAIIEGETLEDRYAVKQQMKS